MASGVYGSPLNGFAAALAGMASVQTFLGVTAAANPGTAAAARIFQHWAEDDVAGPFIVVHYPDEDGGCVVSVPAMDGGDLRVQVELDFVGDELSGAPSQAEVIGFGDELGAVAQALIDASVRGTVALPTIQQVRFGSLSIWGERGELAGASDFGARRRMLFCRVAVTAGTGGG